MKRATAVVLVWCAFALVLADVAAAEGPLTNVLQDGDAIKVEASICEGGPRSPRRRCKVVWESAAEYTLDPARGSRTADVNVTIPEDVRRGNGTLSLRVSVFAPSALGVVATASSAITTFAPRPCPTRLLLWESATAMPPWRPDELFLRWRPRAEILLGFDTTHYPSLAAMPAALRRTANTEEGIYTPVVFISFLGVRGTDTVELNSEATVVQPLRLTLTTMPSSRIVWLASIEASSATMSSRQQQQGFGKMLQVTSREMDDVKAIFLETHPVLIWITVAVSFLHLLFDFLAIKNDVGFWLRRKGDVRGISMWGIASNAVFRVVIFLYLLDNDSSLLVLAPSALVAIVDVWKLTRVFRIERCGKLRLRIVLAASYKLSGTNEFDKKAFRILGIVLLPLVLGYSTYSLVWVRHRGWYSWALSSMASVVYAAGFVLMTPQLFINYKLKTVAHLPWRALVYRALNTFIDDLFAMFLRGIPTMHRLACFRDDIVFLVYLYQRWLYPVDSTRTSDNDAAGTSQKPKSQ